MAVILRRKPLAPPYLPSPGHAPRVLRNLPCLPTEIEGLARDADVLEEGHGSTHDLDHALMVGSQYHQALRTPAYAAGRSRVRDAGSIRRKGRAAP